MQPGAYEFQRRQEAEIFQLIQSLVGQRLLFLAVSLAILLSVVTVLPQLAPWHRYVLLALLGLVAFILPAGVARRMRRDGRFAIIHYLIPMVALVHGAVVYLTGGIMSPFLPLLPVTSLMSGVVYGQRSRALILPMVMGAATLFMATFQGGWVPVIPGLTEGGDIYWRVMRSGVIWLLCLAGARLTGSLIQMYHHTAKDLDISRLARLQAQRDQMESMGLLSRKMAHEIKNPLASIKGLSQLMKQQADVDARAQAHLTVVVDQVQRLEAIVEAYLTHAKPWLPPRFEPLQCQGILNEVKGLLLPQLQTHGLELRVVGDGLLVEFEADRRQLGQVFFNLALNAVESLVSGGRGQGIEIAVDRVDGGLEFVITDDGVGFAVAWAGDLHALIHPDRSTKIGGEGLGLAICQGIIHAHGGQLRLLNGPGGGARVEFTLPLRQGVGEDVSGSEGGRHG